MLVPNYFDRLSSLSSDSIAVLQNKRAKMALCNSPDYQTRFKSTGLSDQEKKFNIDYQDGSHLGFPIRTILATFDLKLISILPMKFLVNWLFGLG